MKTLIVEQMELSIGENQALQVINARSNRGQRARWWFNRMRQIVDIAMPARPQPVPPPEQINFDLSRRREERVVDLAA